MGVILGVLIVVAYYALFIVGAFKLGEWCARRDYGLLALAGCAVLWIGLMEAIKLLILRLV